MSQADGQVVDPTRLPTGFHHDEGDGVLIEGRGRITRLVGDGKNSNLLVFVSYRQKTDLNFPRSRARIFLAIISLGLELERFVTVVVNSDTRLPA
jgi:hypothetical protein